MARDMSQASKQVLFSSNTLFWLGVACLEAPQHLLSSLDDGQHASSVSSLVVNQLQQVQYFGMVAVRRTLEETSLLKILAVFEKLSGLFYSYSLQLEAKTHSFMGILLNAVRNPLCTRDALKTLILSIRF